MSPLKLRKKAAERLFSRVLQHHQALFKYGVTIPVARSPVNNKECDENAEKEQDKHAVFDKFYVLGVEASVDPVKSVKPIIVVL